MELYKVDLEHHFQHRNSLLSELKQNTDHLRMARINNGLQIYENHVKEIRAAESASIKQKKLDEAQKQRKAKIAAELNQRLEAYDILKKEIDEKETICKIFQSKMKKAT